ncbi:MAG: sulfatase-like hydrolase/transferase, partial [Pirellulales bacterium]|nr:sulfatase-like hydrolase/transferase [Pirellulales bacterium]
EDFYTTNAITDYAIRFIDEAQTAKRPFFAYLAYNAPHYPLQAPKKDVLKYRGRYAAGWDKIRQARYARQTEMGLIDAKYKLSSRPKEVPAWEKLTDEERAWDEARMEVFAAMVDCIDQNVGRLVAHLKAKGELDNTLIMICSDNGACPFDRTRGKDKKPWDPASYWCYDPGWAHVGNTPFRWYKQNQHEGGIASPLIVHWPAGLKAKVGSITHQPGHLIDLMATCVDVTGAKYPTTHEGRPITPLQGKSLAPIFRGEEREGHDALYFQFSNNRAVRRGDWKLVSARGGRWELYNLAEDRTELNDLAEENPKLVRQLRTLWHDMAKNTDRAPASARGPAANQIQSFPASSMTRREAGPKVDRPKKRKKKGNR